MLRISGKWISILSVALPIALTAQWWLLGNLTVPISLICALAGYCFALRKFLGPINSLIRQAKDFTEANLHSNSRLPLRPATELGFPLQELSRQFSAMIEAVHRALDQLQTELALRTGKSTRELLLARQFQASLLHLPFPAIPRHGLRVPLRLEFAHLFKPSHSPSGQFFEVVALNDHVAGILIAEVIGEGMCAILGAAILHALFQGLVEPSRDPGQLLQALNQHFHTLMRQSGETIMASAFYLTLDTQKALASYASAGHPATFLVQPQTRTLLSLAASPSANPALGLFTGQTYAKTERTLEAGDLFIFSNESTQEAFQLSGHPFDLQLILPLLEQPPTDRSISSALLAQFHQLFDSTHLPRDLCLLSTEVHALGPLPTGNSPKTICPPARGSL